MYVVQGELARIMMTKNGEHIQRYFDEISEDLLGLNNVRR
jgi:hypothetical protein